MTKLLLRYESGQNANAASPHRPDKRKERDSMQDVRLPTGKLSSVINSGIAALLRPSLEDGEKKYQRI